MSWTGWAVVVLVAVVGGWMLFDGLHALITGDFVTPAGGTHAGRLGPWADLVSGIGGDPRSLLVKWTFVGYAAAYLISVAAFAAGAVQAWWAVALLAVLGLWYLPFGTVANLVVLVLLLTPSLRIRS
ncbi:hypothetical protein [Streptomyces sp. WMMB 322]|uniref:hypothetical protein n=1 Tax=Streptomyces sp. WMMB 322 TaxID=1286821 RepID=UPI0006E3B2C5|nr:hypothetical protein [Streptomyces sp. WMMB 322]SCK59163.1 hypothetical protein H180DRAFT_05667 [Streptomyces sp. WMMB 322]